MPVWFLFIYRWFCFLSPWLWISLYLSCCKILYDIFFARSSRMYGSFQLEFLLHDFLLCVLTHFLDFTFWFILRTWNGRPCFMCLRRYSFLNFWEYQLEFLKILLFFELSVFPKESIWLSASMPHMLTCSICLVHSCLKVRLVLQEDGHKGLFLLEASSLIELAAWGFWVPRLGWQPLLACNGEQIFRVKPCLVNEFGGVDSRKQNFLSVHLPLLQPLWLTWGVPSWRGETPFPVSICLEGADEWLPLSSYFLLVNFHSVLWPVPVITFHTCLTPFLLWAPSTLQANSYYYCLLNSDGKAESYRIKAAMCD